MKLWNEAKNIVKLWIEESVWIVKMVWMTLWIVKLRDNILWIVNSETLLIVKSWFMSKKLWNAIKFVNVFSPNSQNFRRSAPHYKDTTLLSHSLNFRYSRHFTIWCHWFMLNCSWFILKKVTHMCCYLQQRHDAKKMALCSYVSHLCFTKNTYIFGNLQQEDASKCSVFLKC